MKGPKEFPNEKSKKYSKEKLKEQSNQNYDNGLNEKKKKLSKEKLKELPQEKSDGTMKEKSKQTLQKEFGQSSKEKAKKLSNAKSKEPSSHAEDAELLNKLVSVSLENTKYFSEQEDDEENDNYDYEVDVVENNDHYDSEGEVAENGDTSKTPKTRGLTKLLPLFNMKQPVGVKFNDKGQPFCDNDAKLGSFLGFDSSKWSSSTS